jgi:hypothetical protein
MDESVEVKMKSTLSHGTTIELYAELDGVTEYEIRVAGGVWLPLSMQDVEDMVHLWREFLQIIKEGA